MGYGVCENTLGASFGGRGGGRVGGGHAAVARAISLSRGRALGARGVFARGVFGRGGAFGARGIFGRAGIFGRGGMFGGRNRSAAYLRSLALQNQYGYPSDGSGSGGGSGGGGSDSGGGSGSGGGDDTSLTQLEQQVQALQQQLQAMQSGGGAGAAAPSPDDAGTPDKTLGDWRESRWGQRFANARGWLDRNSPGFTVRGNDIFWDAQTHRFERRHPGERPGQGHPMFKKFVNPFTEELELRHGYSGR